MSIRLVRQSSSTPNISNRDDTIMIRNAYGGYSGVVKGVGGELDAIMQNNPVSIELFSGRVVIQGWEIDITSSQTISVESSLSSVYDYLYLEINLLLEEAYLKTIRSSQSTFPLDKGDDLTHNASGTARLPLWAWLVAGNAISNPVRLCEVIPYNKELFEDIYHRLDLLGFREGAASTHITGSTLPVNRLLRQGNYVIGQVKIDFTQSSDEVSWAPGYHDQFIHVCTLGSLFCPKETIEYPGCFTQDIGSSVYFASQGCTVRIDPDGKVYLGNILSYYESSYAHSSTFVAASVFLVIGHEAAALS